MSTGASAQPEQAPSPAPTESPAGSAPDASTGGFDTSKLTPAQQEALRLAIIKISQNPVGNITVVPFQNNFNYGYGPYTRFQYNLNVQPVFPIMLSPSWNLVARTIFPILNQPSALPPGACATPTGCPSTFGIGDTQEQLFFGPKTKPGQLIWAVGPIFQFPTGSPSTLTSGKWSVGPDVVALVTPGKWVMGALMTQLWSFAGPATRPNVSSFLLQPFLNYNLKDGWALSTAPIITANWTAAQNKWAVPLGGGVAKTFKDGDQLMQLSVFYYTYVTRPLASPQTNLKIVWSLLWPVKRGIDIEQLLKQAQ
ncbi:MAG TPA: hypothetical protein VGI19_03515 [Candidatus Cybelea sp.]|jgi:hypothetical protein